MERCTPRCWAPGICSRSDDESVQICFISSVTPKPGRSFGNGKQMFKVASCVACHKFDGQGNDFAPDLTQLDPKWTHTDLVKNIVEPSFLINEKFQTWVFAMNDGKTVTGIILEEKPDSYKVKIGRAHV